MQPYVSPYVDNDKLAMVAAAGVVFLIALILITIITMRIADFIIDSRVGALDRTLGFLYGVARGVLVVAVALLFLNWLTAANTPSWIANAKSRPWLESIGQWVESKLPSDPEDSILRRLSPDDEASEGQTTVPPTGNAPAGDGSAPADSSTVDEPADAN